MIPPDVELDTIEEFQEKLKELNTYDNLRAINLVLTRKNVPNCSQYTNAFISKHTNIPEEIIEKIDQSGIRPLQQMYEVEDSCASCVALCRQGWRINYPWTGTHLVPKTFLPEKTQCKVDDSKRVGSMGFYGSMSTSYSWIWTPLESQTYMIFYRKAEDEIRVYAPQYQNINDRFIAAKSENEFQRMVLFYRLLALGVSEGSLNYGQIAGNDPIVEIIKSDNWRTTPSEFWNNKISVMDQTISGLSNIPRHEALKIVMESFKEEIDQCGSVSEFMETYFPKINILALSAMCQMGKQPA